MNIKEMSLTKKLLIVGFSVGLLMFIVLLSIYPKTKSVVSKNNTYSPTKVPVVVSQNSKSTLPESEIQTPSSISEGGLGKVSFAFSDFSLPQTGTLYKIAPSSIPVETFNKIRTILLPNGTEKTIETPRGKVIVITENQKTLTIYTYSRTISFTDNSSSTENTQVPFVEKARNFINSLSLSIDNSDPQIAYYSTRTSDLTRVDNYNASDVVDVSFRESMNNIIVYRQFGSDSRTHVWITKNGDITKFTYLYPPVYEPVTTIRLPSIEDAKDMINKNLGTIVSLGSEYQQPTLDNVDSTIFSEVSFGYFSDSINSALYPIFVFSGKSSVKGTSYPIVVYLPVDGKH